MAFTDRLANRGSISTGYDIDNSCKFESDNSERLYKTPGGAGNRRTFTISFWTKRTEINGVKQYLFEAGNSDADDDRFTLRFGTGDTFDIQSSSTWLVTNRKFRDTAAWYHFVIKVDTTDGTAANRIKLYINGVEETSFSTDNRSSISQNHDFPVNNTEIHNIGSAPVEGGLYYNGYIAEWVQLDGTATTSTSFGEFDEDSGIWKPKDPSALSFGTNGFWLDFEDSSTLGNDANGGTDFTLSNIAAADQATDTPTNNFATFNVNVPNSSNCAYTEGGTKVINSASAYRSFISTIAVTKGKWYAEFNGGNPNDHFGAEVCPVDANGGNMDQSYMSSFTEGIGYYHNGNKYINDSASSYGNSITNSNLIGCALDMDNGYVYFSKDNTWQNSGDPTSGSSGTGGIALVAASKLHYMGTSNNNTAASYCNFGGYTALTVSSGNTDANGYGNFEHAPPTGYYALCTKNLAEFGG